MSVNVFGLDLDQPVIAGSLSEFVRIFRQNGWLRAVKSFFRHFLFDRPAQQDLSDFLDSTFGSKFTFDQSRLVVGNASSEAVWERIPFKPEVVFSFRVLEHVPPHDLSILVERLAIILSKNAIAYFVITVHTGLIGNHLTEWYPHRVYQAGKKSEPWEHLRKNRYSADTYLNGMTRRAYAALFSQHFEILVDEELNPKLGEEYLTADIESELSEFDRYELLSNDVLFVLRKN